MRANGISITAGNPQWIHPDRGNKKSDIRHRLFLADEIPVNIPFFFHRLDNISGSLAPGGHVMKDRRVIRADFHHGAVVDVANGIGNLDNRCRTK
jgi:hypothetical protein